jgi:hypothetical protein
LQGAQSIVDTSQHTKPDRPGAVSGAGHGVNAASVHEAAHAAAALALRLPLHHVTIRGDGASGGATSVGSRSFRLHREDRDGVFHAVDVSAATAQVTQDFIVMLYAGKAAERLVLLVDCPESDQFDQEEIARLIPQALLPGQAEDELRAHLLRRAEAIVAANRDAILLIATALMSAETLPGHVVRRLWRIARGRRRGASGRPDQMRSQPPVAPNTPEDVLTDMALVALSAAQQMLATVKTITEAKVLRDQFAALEDWVRRQRRGHETQLAAAEWKLRCERKLGDLLAALTRRTLHDARTGRRQGSSRSLPCGITWTESHRWQRAASVPEPTFEEWLAQTREAGGDLTSAGLRALARPAPTPRVQWKDLFTDEQRELRRIAAEMDTYPFVTHTFTDDPRRPVIGGAAGAPVYWDIVGGDPKVGRPHHKYSRGDVAKKLHAFITHGKASRLSNLVVDVARRRLASDRSLSKPSLPESAGDAPSVPVWLTAFMAAKAERLQHVLGINDLSGTVAAAVLHLEAHVLRDHAEAEPWKASAPLDVPLNEASGESF